MKTTAVKTLVVTESFNDLNSMKDCILLKIGIVQARLETQDQSLFKNHLCGYFFIKSDKIIT